MTEIEQLAATTSPIKNRVLIVEDDYAISRGLRDSFSDKGYKVYFALDGEDALKQALSIELDVILLDIMLPKMNGFEVCSRVREAHIETPIIMLTAKGEEDSIIKGLEIGADDYVLKPFSIKQLHARCEAFIRRYKQEQSTFSFGNFELDTDAKTLTHADRGTIRLTPKEYKMLVFFVKKRGHALTRDTLLSAVWGDSTLTLQRSVDRGGRRIIKKIEPDPKRPKLLVSLRDIGYRFDS